MTFQLATAGKVLKSIYQIKASGRHQNPFHEINKMLNLQNDAAMLM